MMDELPDGDAEILEELKKFSEKRRNTLESEREYVTRSDKYDYAIGIDAEGRSYPVHRGEVQPRGSEISG